MPKKKAVTQPTAYDLILVGGGPAGLAMAAAVKGLRVCLVEKLTESQIANPVPDGREIALTHSSIAILKELDLFRRIPAPAVSPIKEARVLNGTSPYVLNFDSRDEGKDALGYLIGNHHIRKAAYDAVRGQNGLDLRCGVEVTGLVSDMARNTVTLSDGQTITAPLVIAADSRFSPCRRLMGVPVAMRDFGRTVIVCRLRHEKPHHNVAFECFHYERTLAILPLNGSVSSAVITLPSEQAAAMMAMPAAAFSRDVSDRFGGQLGAMTLDGARHAYPLVATYADRFIAPRFALLGDAAVGMHPVTAHGYNFGLYGVHVLAREIRAAQNLGIDIGSSTVLDAYNRAHRRATLPIYLGTNALVSLFTDERPAAKLARAAMLRLGNLALPIKTLITRQLTQTSLAG